MKRSPESIDDQGRLAAETGIAEGSPSEFYELNLLRYQLEGDWQDCWAADMHRLGRSFRSLHIPVDEILSLIDEAVLEEKTKEMEILDDNDELNVEGQRLLLTLQLQNHRRKRLEIRARQAVCQERIQVLASRPEPVLDLHRRQNRLEALLRPTWLDFRTWDNNRLEYLEICVSYAKEVEQLFKNN